MKYLTPAILIIALAGALSSCGTFRSSPTNHFRKIENKTERRHYYGYADFNKQAGYNAGIMRLFNMREDCDFFNLEFLPGDSVKLSYWSYGDSGAEWKENVFKGKWRSRYFEIYFSKEQFVIPLLFSRIDVDRVRVGISTKGDLLITNLYNRSGNLLLLAGGEVSEHTFIFRSSHNVSYPLPLLLKERWGFQKDGNIVVAPVYDYVHAFRNGAAVVRQNGKSGLIDTAGNLLLNTIYDSIGYYTREKVTPFYNVQLKDKYGMTDTLGRWILDPVYDSLGNLFSDEFLFVKEGKFGYANHEGEIIPPVFDHSFYFSSPPSIFPFRNPNIEKIRKEGVGYVIDRQDNKFTVKFQNGKYHSFNQVNPR